MASHKSSESSSTTHAINSWSSEGYSRVSSLDAFRFPNQDSDRVGSSSYDWYQSVRAQTAVKGLDAALFGEQMETRMSPCVSGRKFILGDKQTETPHLFPEPDMQAVEPFKLPPAVRRDVSARGHPESQYEIYVASTEDERVSTQEKITATLSTDEKDANRISTYDFITTKLLGDDVQMKAPNVSLEQTDKQAVEQSKLLPSAREYVDAVGEWDILCGRGGKGNNHSGNKRYRKVVSQMGAMYRDTAAKSVKTNLSKCILEYVSNYGGRFLKKDKEGRYFVMTKADAREKTSQALREKPYKWTKVDVEDKVQV